MQLQTLKERAKLDAEPTTLRVQCLQAEAEPMELKEKIGILERKGGYRVSPTTNSATLRSYSHSALGGLGSGLTAQASPQLGRGMSGLGLPQVPTPPLAGQGLPSYLARSWTGSLDSTPTPSPGTGSGLSTLAPSPYLGASPRAWKGYGFLTTHSGAEFGRGRSNDLCVVIYIYIVHWQQQHYYST